MTPERWQKVDEVFQAALDRPLPDRASFLDEACAGDAELKSEAESLVKAYDQAADFIEQPAAAEDARVLVDALDHNIGGDVGAYTILERLGAGGMGEVYLAEDRRLKRPVALKILPAFFAVDDMRLRRFQREAQAASALNHPNILTIHEVGQHEDVWFIATEFIDGQTIRELMAGPELAVAEVLDIVEQVTSGLAAAHAAGIVHRDIKPENIMRRGDGLVKILDFGIVKLMEQRALDGLGASSDLSQSHTELGAVMGTAGYMSPEQARGLPVDERTDIWSLGVVLYEMLAQRAPFSGETRMDTMVAILEREPPPLFGSREQSSGVQSLQLVVDKALRKERHERYQTADEMLADLTRLKHELKDSPAAVMSARPIGGTPQVSKRRRFIPMATAVLVLIAAIAATVFYNRAASPSQPNISSKPLPKKLYSQMNEAEQLGYLRTEEQRISAMMGDRPAKLNDEALRLIKAHVDRYLARGQGAGRDAEAESVAAVLARAQPYAPLIAREFAARKVPVIIGLYLPLIESNYESCVESSLGAKGLFQFLPQTAKHYGVSREEMCDAQKMTRAAAAYIADHMAELGDDAESITLVLLSYNRGAEWVRGTLRELRDTDNFERNFWTLFAHRDQLDESFRRESASYVPRFFAAAIIGENPEVFGIEMPALSTFTQTQ